MKRSHRAVFPMCVGDRLKLAFCLDPCILRDDYSSRTGWNNGKVQQRSSRRWSLSMYCQNLRWSCHRRTSRGAGEAAALPRLGQTIIFRAKANFFRQKPAAKMKKRNIFLYLSKDKTEFIPSTEINCRKSGIFTNNYWVGMSWAK